MALVRGFAHVDDRKKVTLPEHIAHVLKLKPGTLVELKVLGAHNAPFLVIHKRKRVR